MLTKATTRFSVVHELTEEQYGDLYRMCQNERWTTGRTELEVRESVENSDEIVGIVDGSVDRLVGFIRVLTDYRFFCVVLDVIVHEDYRGMGLGRMAMEAVIDHPRLQDLKGIGLQCEPPIKPFYENLGFSLSDPTTRHTMVRTFPDRP